MADKHKETQRTEQRIGNTVYVISSHFPIQGSTAVDKIRRLIDIDTKTMKCNKVS